METKYDHSATSIDFFKRKKKLYAYFVSKFGLNSKLGRFDEKNNRVKKKSIYLEYYFGSLWLIRALINEKIEAYCKFYSVKTYNLSWYRHDF